MQDGEHAPTRWLTLGQGTLKKKAEGGRRRQREARRHRATEGHPMDKQSVDCV